MTKTFRAVGVAASLLMGTALAASAAVPADTQGNTAPTTSSVQPGTRMAPGYQGGMTSTTTTQPGYQTSESGNPATVTPHVNRGNAEGAAGGAGGGSGGSGGGSGGSGR